MKTCQEISLSGEIGLTAIVAGLTTSGNGNIANLPATCSVGATVDVIDSFAITGTASALA